MKGEASPDATIAERLANYVVGLTYEDLPPQVIEATKALIIDQLACQLIGSTLPWTTPALRLIQMTEGAKAESTVVNHGSKFLAADVAFINATYGQACEMDDHAGSGSSGHVGPATIPVAMAMGEREAIDGRQFLVAIVAGYEVMYRLMKAITPYNNVRGFHSQSIAGPFAGAATAGKILGIDAGQMTHAFAIAGSHSCGSTEYDQSGGEVKRIHAGLGARGGIHSAFLAKSGLTGPRTIVEGKRGFCNLFSDRSNPALITEKLGETFGVVNVAFKFYPTVGSIQTSIAAVGRLVASHDIQADQIDRIKVGLSEIGVHHGAGIGKPSDVLSAQFSLAYSLALAVVKRSNDLPHYMNQALWNDPAILNLIGRVETYIDPAAVGEKLQMATVTMTMKDGRSLHVVETDRKGSRKNPLTKEERYAKARGLAGAVLGKDEIEELIETIERVETLDDISALTNRLVRKA